MASVEAEDSAAEPPQPGNNDSTASLSNGVSSKLPSAVNGTSKHITSPSKLVEELGHVGDTTTESDSNASIALARRRSSQEMLDKPGEIAPSPPKSASSFNRDVLARTMSEEMMPSVAIHEDLTAKRTATAPATRDNASPPPSDDAQAFVKLSGRQGHADCINGRYVQTDDEQHDDRPVFRHDTPIPAGYSSDSGKRLWLVYHEDNDAWAISTELGSLDVLAYVMGDIFNPNAYLYDDATWYVSNGQGDYEADANIRIQSSLLAPRKAALIKATQDIGLPSQAQDEMDEDEDEQPAPELHLKARSQSLTEGTVRPPAATSNDLSPLQEESSTDDGARASTDQPSASASATSRVKGNRPRAATEGALPDDFADSDTASIHGSENGAFSGSVRRRKGSIGSFTKAMIKRIPGRKRAQRVYQDSKIAMKRMSGRETPCEALKRHVVKAKSANNVKDKDTFMADVLKTLQRGRNHRDDENQLRACLLDAWELSLNVLTSAGENVQVETHYEIILTILTRSEVQLHSLFKSDAKADWVPRCCQLTWQTHEYVVGRLSGVITEEQLLLFCAKVVAINYLVVPGLSQVIIRAVSRNTPIVGRRSFKIGQNVTSRCVKEQDSLARVAPLAQRNLFYNIHQLARVEVGSVDDQCAATLPKSKFHHPYARLTTSTDTLDILDRLKTPQSPVLLDDRFWRGRRAESGRWTARFVTRTDAGFGFLSVFLEVLIRRAQKLFAFDYYSSKPDELLGVNQKHTSGVVLMPGFIEMAACFLRLSLTTQLAIKRNFLVGHGPPSLICNWTDRTAAAALAMSTSGVFLTCLLEDLMMQTGLHYVPDVIALLGSFKALFESYQRMHQDTLPADLDMDLMVHFLRELIFCSHYVVTMFTIRWLYEVIDYFSPPQRVIISHLLCQEDVLERLLCHWESGVRHLALTFIAYRIFAPEQMRLQSAFLSRLCNILDQPRLQHPKFNVQEHLEADTNPKITTLVAEQCNTVVDFILDLLEGHECSEPPYSLKTMVKMDTVTRPIRRSRYAAACLAQACHLLGEAHTWVSEHRIAGDEDRGYPPLTLSLPPMQNLSSMYSAQRPSRK
eukprot:TRINITY_DN10127_c0_g1_i1.p1 TRINITY_DN10127_c0_g1~~TRINITY_DN10127_c0_g1_i1.p1  ORF type:complete len:1081 (+),score=238.98 TRINITY_DN10127_c0_g1_i1:101-3343(+)